MIVRNWTAAALACALAGGLFSALPAAPAAPARAALTPPAALTAWRWMPDASSLPDPANAPEMDANALGWQSAAVGDDVFQGRLGYAWFQTTLPKSASPPRRIHFESVDDNAAVYLNGRQIAHHEVWNDPFDALVGTAWHTSGPNVLTVRVQNTAGGGGIIGPVREEFSDPVTLRGGRFVALLDAGTGGLSSLTNSTDPAHMNWVHAGGVWGTGWLRRGGQKAEWRLTAPVRLGPGSTCTAQYEAGAARIAVRRQVTSQERLSEMYTITNTGKQPLALAEGDLGIRTPFNDTYSGGASACLTGRCNAHLWCGGSTAYACALRMGGAGPHLGLVLTQPHRLYRGRRTQQRRPGADFHVPGGDDTGSGTEPDDLLDTVLASGLGGFLCTGRSDPGLCAAGSEPLYTAYR